MRARLGRLKKRADFLRVAARKVKFAAPGLILQAAPQPDDSKQAYGMRVGFTASRKVGNAVRRNRARRRLKAAAAEVLPLSGRAETDYVLICRQETIARDYAALKADLERAVREVAARLNRRPEAERRAT